MTDRIVRPTTQDWEHAFDAIIANGSLEHLVQAADAATGAVVFAAEWDSVSAVQRQLHTFQAQPLQLGRDYRAWIAWDKPMRWRTGGQVAVLPGQPALTLNVARAVTVGDTLLEATVGPPRWLDQPGASPGGYRRYRDDGVLPPVRAPQEALSCLQRLATIAAAAA